MQEAADTSNFNFDMDQLAEASGNKPLSNLAFFLYEVCTAMMSAMHICHDVELTALNTSAESINTCSTLQSLVCKSYHLDHVNESWHTALGLCKRQTC